jgi:2-keto-3-deoxy-6-phosphogluconate aldolase
MCNVATAVKDVITFEQCTIYQGVTYIEVAIDADDPYRSFKKLPDAIEYNGTLLGKTCFDSDKNRAYYRSDAKNVARIVRG